MRWLLFTFTAFFALATIFAWGESWWWARALSLAAISTAGVLFARYLERKVGPLFG